MFSSLPVQVLYFNLCDHVPQLYYQTYQSLCDSFNGELNTATGGTKILITGWIIVHLCLRTAGRDARSRLTGLSSVSYCAQNYYYFLLN